MSIITSLAPQAVSLPGDALTTDADGKPILIGGACRACGHRMFPQAPVCPACMSEDIAHEAMPREGSLYAFTIVHVGPKAWEKPFATGYVDLDNGVRVFSHLRGELTIGGRVRLATAIIGKTDTGTSISTFVFQP